MDNSIIIGITELRAEVDSKQSLEERLKVAMRAALKHWLVTDEESQFKMAVGAVMVDATEEERNRLERELRFLRSLSAAAGGVPVNFSSLFEDLERDKGEIVGLSGLWDDAKKGR